MTRGFLATGMDLFTANSLFGSSGSCFLYEQELQSVMKRVGLVELLFISLERRLIWLVLGG